LRNDIRSASPAIQYVQRRYRANGFNYNYSFIYMLEGAAFLLSAIGSSRTEGQILRTLRQSCNDVKRTQANSTERVYCCKRTVSASSVYIGTRKW
jgi:hypothetical protein